MPSERPLTIREVERSPALDGAAGSRAARSCFVSAPAVRSGDRAARWDRSSVLRCPRPDRLARATLLRSGRSGSASASGRNARHSAASRFRVRGARLDRRLFAGRSAAARARALLPWHAAHGCILASTGAARVLLVGGPPFPETILMWWNFVARTPEEIRDARDDWESGRRFGDVTAYKGQRLHAPELVRLARPNPVS